MTKDQRRPRVLVIDDSEIVLSRVKSRLEAEGYEVVTTTRTVGTARHLPNVDLVIVDYHMPGIDGAAVVASLKAALGASTKVPLFYLYTSNSSLRGTYRQLGFDGAFTNKGDDDELVRQVDAAYRLVRMKNLSKKT